MKIPHKARSILIESLQEYKSLEIDFVILAFAKHGLNNPERLAKELVWEFVEAEKTRFNNEWFLELILKNEVEES